MGCDGSGQTNLTNNSAEDKQPSWATGGKLAFSSNRNSGGGYDIYLLTLSPWNIERLTTNAANDESPALSPDGSKVAFVSYRDDTEGDIYVLTVSDKSVARITDNTAKDLDPAWSPDGSKVVFASDRDGNFDIFKANPDGTGDPDKVTTVSHSTGNDRWPDLVDYDGDENIVFASDRDGDWEVFYYDGYELTLRQLTISNKVDSLPGWSKSGEQMVFHSNRDADSKFDIFKAYYDGAEATNLNRNSTAGNDSSPDWEPVDSVDFCSGDE